MGFPTILLLPMTIAFYRRGVRRSAPTFPSRRKECTVPTPCPQSTAAPRLWGESHRRPSEREASITRWESMWGNGSLHQNTVDSRVLIQRRDPSQEVRPRWFPPAGLDQTTECRGLHRCVVCSGRTHWTPDLLQPDDRQTNRESTLLKSWTRSPTPAFTSADVFPVQNIHELPCVRA